MPRCEFRDSVLRRILRNSEKEQSEALAGGLYYRGLSKQNRVLGNIIRVRNYLRNVCLFFLVSFFVFERLLGLRGQAGGRREGGGWIFPRETLIGFPRETTVFLTSTFSCCCS